MKEQICVLCVQTAEREIYDVKGEIGMIRQLIVDENMTVIFCRVENRGYQ